ncbi:MAG: hypothetical protein IJO40_11275 [Thermoguttaceae bacterium]|nr:hypothetical protein [Thermoguttaceae bacterium]
MTIKANGNRDFNESGDRGERNDIDVRAEFAAFGVSRGTLWATEFAELLEKTEARLVGVTGRRHIVPEAWGAVESAARTAARALVAAAGEDGRPIYVATGLAIGADQLAAKLVLEARAEAEARGEASPLRLVALLPMSVAEYRRDFSTKPGTGKTASASELDDFDRYLASANLVVEIEPTLANVERAERGEPLDRTAQYAALGDFLVERSRLLWAFWSGDASNVKPGGTTDVVLRKTRRLANVDDGENVGNVRASSEASAEAVCCVATPEVLRVKNPDGTKARIPESTENAGKLAFWTSPIDAPPKFESPENVVDDLKRFWKRK